MPTHLPGLLGQHAFQELPGTWTNMVVVYTADHIDDYSAHSPGLAQQLAARGTPVLYVNPPSPHTPTELALHSPHLAMLNLSSGITAGRLGRRGLGPTGTPFTVRSAIRALNGTVRAVLHAARHPFLLRQLDAQVKIFWVRRDYPSHASSIGQDPDRAAALEQRLARDADLILAGSPLLATRWGELGFRTSVLPPGCQETDDEPADDSSAQVYLPRPIAGMVHPISNQIDVQLLLETAKTGVSVLLVGHRAHTADPQRWQPLLDFPNVQWVQPRQRQPLGEFYRMIDVGVWPLADTASNRARFHNEPLQHLAYGTSLISTDMPSVGWLAHPDATIASRTEFATLVQDRLTKPGDDSQRAARQEFAAHHTWSARADALLDIFSAATDLTQH